MRNAGCGVHECNHGPFKEISARVLIKHGLHCRPSCLISRYASFHKACLYLGLERDLDSFHMEWCGRKYLYIKDSTLDLMELGVTHGEKVFLLAHGPEDAELLERVRKVLENEEAV